MPIPQSASKLSTFGSEEMRGLEKMERAERTLRAIAQTNPSDSGAMRSYNWDRTPDANVPAQNRVMRGLNEAEAELQLRMEEEDLNPRPPPL